MPRKSKDELNIPNNEILEENKNKSKSSKKKAETNKKSVSKKAETTIKTADVAKTTAKAKSTATKTTAKAKATSTKTTTTKSKATTAKSKKQAAAKTTKKVNSTTIKKSNAKKTVSQKKATSADKKTIFSNIEYYDLPYRYNQTVVKILAQTPTTLFIYWDISDEDRSLYIEKYGNDFFNNTKPVLLVTNKTMNYSFEVEINDFANSWYLHVNDANCDYVVELARKPIHKYSNINNYVHISNSNDMEMPNNHILFDKLGKSVFFKDVKNNFVEEKNISSLSFIRNLGKIYDIYEIYKELYKDEIDIEELNNHNIKLNLSSSNSSTFK